MREIKKVVAYYCCYENDTIPETEYLELQKKEVEKYCEQHNYIIIDEYIDTGIDSRKPYQNQHKTELGNLFLDRVYVGEDDIHAVVVFKLAIFSKSITNLARLFKTMSEKDVNFLSVQDEIDTSSPFGKIFISMTNIFSELEND